MRKLLYEYKDTVKLACNITPGVGAHGLGSCRGLLGPEAMDEGASQFRFSPTKPAAHGDLRGAQKRGTPQK